MEKSTPRRHLPDTNPNPDSPRTLHWERPPRQAWVPALNSFAVSMAPTP